MMTTQNRRKWLRILRVGLIGVGILFIVIGLLREEQIDILIKAVRICLECIGIG